MAIKIIMPKLGESVVEGTVVNWLKKEGETVEEFESLLEVESAKVSTEIPSPASGILLKILVSAGTTVNAETVIGWIGEENEVIQETNDPSEPNLIVNKGDLLVEEKNVEQEVDYSAGRNVDLGFISPVVAKIAQEYKINLDQINGTGQGGRITKKDLTVFLESRKEKPQDPEKAAWETPGEGDLFRPTELQFPGKFVNPSEKKVQNQPGEIRKEENFSPSRASRVIPHTKRRKSIADHMVMSKHTSPHVTTVMEVDLIKVVSHRDEVKAMYVAQGAKLTFTAYFISAISQALTNFPIVNSSWSDEGIELKPDINIGMATSLGQAGLIVPVIRNADSLSLLGLARKINDLAERARNQKLKPDEVIGGSFTITNHGTSGSLFATPIINQPQCAILGVGAIQKRVTVINDAIAIRPMVYLSLTFDHRILDGASADGFLAKIVDILENWN